MKLYVAGPMRGLPLYNFPLFDDATAHLRSLNYEVINPAEIDRELGFDPETGTDEDFEKLGGIEAAMSRDFAAILDCDGIALLPGWERSTGARAEVFIAQTTGRRVFKFIPHLLSPLLPLTDTGVTLPAAPADDGEVRITSATGGQKGKKLAQVSSLDPVALRTVAEVSGFGATKYAPHNFLKGYAWSLSFDACLRHLMAFWEGENTDEESGLPHLGHAAWHCMALISFLQRDIGTDDRFVQPTTNPEESA